MIDDHDPKHIAKREALHAGAAGALYLGVLLVLWWVSRKLPKLRHRIAAAAFIEVCVGINEIHDLVVGGWWVKSVIDMIWWAFILTLLIIGIYRFETLHPEM